MQLKISAGARKRTELAGPPQRFAVKLINLRVGLGNSLRAFLARIALSPYIHGPIAQCPFCQSSRLKKLIERDRIDKFASTLWSRFERLRGGSLYHCAFCRVQFYDTRPLQAPLGMPPASRSSLETLRSS